MKYLREKCVLCSSSRKIEKIRKFSKYNVCTICISKNQKLKSYIKEYDRLLTGKYLSNINNDIYNEKYLKNKEADQAIEAIIEDIISSNNKKKKIKKTILRKVKKNVNNSNKKEIKNTLDSFSINDLEECEDSLNNATDIQSFKENVIIKKKTESIEIPDPKMIIKNMNQHIIDQEEAVNAISISLIQHLCRKKDPLIPKNNILLLGPTGTGKTELARIMANFLKVPLVILDSTSLTSEGYVGASLNDTLINSLLSKTNGDQEVAENSIVFIDEIDKKATSQFNSQSDVNTLAIQNELLKILEGSEIRGQIQDGKNVKRVTLNTSNILFICAGAFSGLENIVEKKNKSKIGLQQNSDISNKNSLLSNEIQTEDLVEYGLTPEFLGRFSTITYTRTLSDESLLKILTNKKNSIVEQYLRIFKQFNVEVEFSNNFLFSVISEAQEQKIGARGLYRIFSKRIKPILVDIYSFINKKIVIKDKEEIIVINKS